jgi:hypothetical protein
MYLSGILKLIIIATFWIASSCKENKDHVVQNSDVSRFLGQWTFDIGTNQVGWLEVRQEEGYLEADLLWAEGSVLPVPYIFMGDERLYVGRNNRKFVRTRDENGNELRAHNFPAWMEIKSGGENITGHLLTPKSTGIGFDSVYIKGAKLPDVPPAPDLNNLSFGTPIHLISKNDITGWKLIEKDRVNGWSVIDGVLINNPVQKEGTTTIRYGNLRTEQEFEDFNLKFEVNVPVRSNSGVYLRGRHEIQVSDSYGRPLGNRNMGALYSRITPLVNAEKPAGEWQTMDITYCDRHVTIILNGITIIDNQPVYGPTGGALTSDVLAPGPIFLQGDHGKILYKNMVLTPIISQKVAESLEWDPSTPPS